MLKNKRIPYFILIIITILLGISSRKTDSVPTYFGDILYAVMIYFGLRMLFINLNSKKTIILALIFCFGVEFLQLYRAEWMLAIRSTSLGHYALGQGFLWSDLGYYTFGILMAFLMEFIWVKRN